MRGSRSAGSDRPGARFAGFSTVWDEFGQTYYVNEEGQLLSEVPEEQQAVGEPQEQQGNV